MGTTASYSFRLDSQAKEAAQEAYRHYGISLANAINAFLVKSAEVGGFPFSVSPSISPSVSPEPFESEEEATEFIASTVRRMLDEAR